MQRVVHNCRKYKLRFENPRMDSGTRVFVDKLKDMEPTKTMAEAKEACRLTR